MVRARKEKKIHFTNRKQHVQKASTFKDLTLHKRVIMV